LPIDYIWHSHHIPQSLDGHPYWRPGPGSQRLPERKEEKGGGRRRRRKDDEGDLRGVRRGCYYYYYNNNYYYYYYYYHDDFPSLLPLLPLSPSLTWYISFKKSLASVCTSLGQVADHIRV